MDLKWIVVHFDRMLRKLKLYLGCCRRVRAILATEFKIRLDRAIMVGGICDWIVFDRRRAGRGDARSQCYQTRSDFGTSGGVNELNSSLAPAARSQEVPAMLSPPV